MTELIFDLIIFGFLTITAFAAGFFVWMFLAYKRTFKPISALVLAAVLLSFGVVFYGSFIEPRRIQIMQHQIEIKNARPLKIVFFADLHAGRYKKEGFVKDVVEKINTLSPDLVLIGGDFISDGSNPIPYLKPLASLKAPLGKYAVLGNHDYVDYAKRNHSNFNFADNERVLALLASLKTLDVKVLRNESVEIKSGKTGFLLGGIDEIWTGRADIEKTFRNVITRSGATKQSSLGPAALTTILLAHNPDVAFGAAKYGIDYVFAGHTHCGQIRLPFIGSLAKVPTKLGNNYDCGLYSFDQKAGKKTQLFITAGVGEWGVRARLFNRPEVAVFDVISTSSK